MCVVFLKPFFNRTDWWIGNINITRIYISLSLHMSDVHLVTYQIEMRLEIAMEESVAVFTIWLLQIYLGKTNKIALTTLTED